MITSRNVYVVIVTYANRFYLIQQVLQVCIANKVGKIVVVDNGSCCESYDKIIAYAKHYEDIVILSQDKNYGSAAGYKKGLEFCFNDQLCQYIWFLDDDNRPNDDALSKLLDYWNNHVIKNQEKKIALLSLRKDRKEFREAIDKKNSTLMLGRKNSFLGFHFLDFLGKFLNFFQGDTVSNSKQLYGVVAVAPYGGLFLSKKMIQLIGYPDETFFVYADDYDFTFRITNNRGKIILVTESIITDLEKSFHKKKGLLKNKIIKADNSKQIYYMTRNCIRFESKFITNKIVYFFNIAIYNIFFLFLLFFNINIRSLKNYFFYIKGAYDGLTYT